MDPNTADILISRVVDQEARDADWATLEALGSQDPAVWRDLALALRMNQQLASEVALATAPATNVSISDELFDTANSEHAERSLAERVRGIGSWGGWIAAALLIAVFGRAGLNQPNNPGVANASLGLAPAEYLSHYLSTGQKDGTVVGEMPRKLLLDTTPAEDGGVYVLYVRQIVERVKVDDLYRISVDELGNPAPVKLPAEVRTPVTPNSPM
jgi:hypothetical protein